MTRQGRNVRACDKTEHDTARCATFVIHYRPPRIGTVKER
jgi:hypothetical protein